MQSEGVAADIATRCGFVQRVAQTVVYCSRVLLNVEAIYCWSVIDGQAACDEIGKLRARVPLVGEVDGDVNSELGRESCVCLSKIALPMKPPVKPATKAMISPYSGRKSHPLYLCQSVWSFGW
jgi:hypothetical protein